MHDDELWQVYNDNGTLVAGKGSSKQDFETNPDLIMGNAHVWFWRRNGVSTEIMLQKRSMLVSTRPGWYHASAAGHINLGETPTEAATREAKEEMDLTIDQAKLYYVYSLRTLPSDPQSFVHVFLYHLTGEERITHLDGEAVSYEWRSLANWKEMITAPEEYRLVPQGDIRFALLTTALEFVASR